ncbi:MAG: MarR family winged helix-turn-helix transcriptional regulator [Hyphomonadaceae bacterium]
MPSSEDRLAHAMQEGLDQCLCLNLRAAARRVTQFYEARLAAADLSIAQFAILAHTAAKKSPAMAEIAESMALDPSTLSRTLKPMEEAGFLSIEADPDNRRVRRVRLTKPGKAKLKEASALWIAAQDAAARALSPAFLRELKRGVAQL